MLHRVLSCVPKQMIDTAEKLKWLSRVCKEHKPHIFVTPQEFFGGAVMMPLDRDHRYEDLFPKLSKICKNNNTAMAVGVQQRDDDGANRSAIWFINEKGIYQGRLCKFALPKYDHVKAKGFGQVSPENNIENRFGVFKFHQMYVSAVFCWEVYADLLWTGLGILKPDLVFNMIKFGVNAWPTVKKVDGRQTVVGFGYGRWAEVDDGGWINRLKMASTWQVKCPVVCSTNSWDLNPRCMPLCGTISEIDGQAPNDLWYPQKDDKLKEIPEKIIVTEINEDAVRATLQNKFIYKDLVGELPPLTLGRYTMHLKMNRIENRLLKGRTIEKEKRNKNQPKLKDEK